MGQKIIEKLKTDLAKTPELESRFNLQMEGIVNGIKKITTQFQIETIREIGELTKALTSEQFRKIGELYNDRESDYNSLRNEKSELLKHKGVYAPKYAFEFLDWFFDCYLFGKPMHVKEDEGLSLYHFQLYNEYVDRLFEHKNWTDKKEIDFLNKQFNNEEEMPPIKEMNLDELDKWCKPDPTTKNKLMQLKSDLSNLLPTYKKYQITAVAHIIYESDVLHKNTKPKSFNAWKKTFIEIAGSEPKNNYKYSHNLVQAEISEMEKTFYYLFPNT